MKKVVANKGRLICNDFAFFCEDIVFMAIFCLTKMQLNVPLCATISHARGKKEKTGKYHKQANSY